MSGKNAETFSLIRFGVFIKSPKRFFKSPKPSGNPAGIVRSLEANYAVVGAESCGRLSLIVRSLRAHRAVNLSYRTTGSGTAGKPDDPEVPDRPLPVAVYRRFL